MIDKTTTNTQKTEDRATQTPLKHEAGYTRVFHGSLQFELYQCNLMDVGVLGQLPFSTLKKLRGGKTVYSPHIYTLFGMKFKKKHFF
jgi:hypothetical protein